MSDPDLGQPLEGSPSTSHAEALHADSYTARRLRDATPEHLYLTARRCFIGPLPKGWLQSHRRDWYKKHLPINSSSRVLSFSADERTSRHKRLSGLEGPSTSALYNPSFPQPEDLEEEDEDESPERGVATHDPPAVDIPRASAAPPEVPSQSAIDDAEEDQTDIQATPLEPLSEPASPAGLSRARSSRSFVTAREVPVSAMDTGDNPEEDEGSQSETGRMEPARENVELAGVDGTYSRAGSSLGVGGYSTEGPPEGANSTSSLIQHETSHSDRAPEPVEDATSSRGIISRIKTRQRPGTRRETEDASERPKRGRGLVHFDVPEESTHAELHVKARMAQRNMARASRKLRRSRIKDGQIVKMERMLVRVDETMAQLPDDFDENEGQKVETRTSEKWREYMVVCRQSTAEDAEFNLRMYKTRVIPAIEETHVKARFKHEIPLGRKTAKVNLYSSLDKSIAIWTPKRKGTAVYIMQARSASAAVEWYTFLRNTLGWQRADELQVNVPDLSISLRIWNPFSELEASRDLVRAAEGDDQAIMKAMRAEQAVAGRIIELSIQMLRHAPEWQEVIDLWTSKSRMGLAWKRYDRLEWIYGANERKMYGTMAMMKSHDLELRPKHHYPTEVKHKKHGHLVEPPPVEGFLIRLTSQRGMDQKMGRLFYKRLYFSTHDQYLCFCRPAKACPPPPPKMPMTENARVPKVAEIQQSIPLIYAVNPFPVKDGEIEWLREEHSGTAFDKRRHDIDAYDEAERNVNHLLNCDGYIDLCNVTRVRNVVRGATPADANIEEGSDVDFDEDARDSLQDDGTTHEFDDDRTFELVLRNGLIVRLQAYDKETKREWQKRLHNLSRYWKHRTAADIALYKSVRKQNLDLLNIDEEGEAQIGQFAKKWEVSSSFASAELYHMCGVSHCRAITMSGVLFRKPRRHSTFTRCRALLSNGHLLVFQDVLRGRTGRPIAQVHHDRLSSLDLRECYVYSGLLTEADLLYHNQTFDANKPGHHALPRLYPEDGWTSTDEDVMTCFVIWHGRRKSWFRHGGGGDDAAGTSDSGSGTAQVDDGGRRGRFKLVSQLGVPGRSIVFRTRSRAERDHWVLALQTAIERVRRGEDFRITEGTKT